MRLDVLRRRTAPRARLRPPGFDELGLRRVLGDRLLPLLVGAMAFLGALALGGAVAVSALTSHWQGGIASNLTAQVPRPREAASGTTRLDRAATLLRGMPGVLGVRVLDPRELDELLRPWLGSGSEAAVPLPGVIEVRLADPALDVARLAERLAADVPGALLEDPSLWLARLAALARSLQVCAALALLVVTGVAAAVIAVATRAGLSARRDAIEIVHGLGATDHWIAGRFAARATVLAGMGGAAGTVLAVPLLLVLSFLAAPFTAAAGAVVPGAAALPFGPLPAPLWAGLVLLPGMGALIGWATAQATVRIWLRRLP